MLRSAKTALAIAGGVLAMGAAGAAQTVTYYLNQSDTLADGVNYLRVDITQEDADTWKFVVDALVPPLVVSGTNFGTVEFGFNATQSVQSITFGTTQYGGSPNTTNLMDGFGIFENQVIANQGSDTTDPITFFVNFGSPGEPGSGWWQENATTNDGGGAPPKVHGGSRRTFSALRSMATLEMARTSVATSGDSRRLSSLSPARLHFSALASPV